MLRRRLGFLAMLLALPGCGYQPVYGSPAPEQRLSLVGLPGRVPRVELTQAALEGARLELARAGVLSAGSSYPRMVLEIVRQDELGSGIVARDDPASARTIPLARGLSVGIVGRAWVLEAPGAEPLRDTGDVRRVEQVAAQPTAFDDARARDEAAVVAARRLGHVLARQVLGQPRASLEEM